MQNIIDIDKIKNIAIAQNISRDFVVLDVDRTIINTTSWFHACKCSDLLISQKNIREYLRINDETFAKGTTDAIWQYRKDTLSLLERTVSRRFLDKIAEFDICKYFTEGDFTCELRLYVAGLYVSYKNVTVYSEAIKFIEFCHRYYGENLIILFLSAGYSPFIRGVIDGIFEQMRTTLDKIRFSVIGSEIEIIEGVPTELLWMNQFNKGALVEEMISNGAKIRFLADDSSDNDELYILVRNHGGIVHKVEHTPNQKFSKSWETFNQLLSNDRMKELLKNENFFSSLQNNFFVMPTLLSSISKSTNEIGIVSIPYSDYISGLQKLLSKISNPQKEVLFRDGINELVYLKNDNVFLRGTHFYNWLPPYVFTNNNTLNERWRDMFTKTINMMEIVNQKQLLIEQSSLTYAEKAIVFMLFDHLLEGIYYILNLCEQSDIEKTGMTDISDEDVKLIKSSAEDTSFLFYRFISDCKIDETELNRTICNLINMKTLACRVPDFTKSYRFMRELDNNISIYNFVKYIVLTSKINKLEFDYIIAFPYGGIALGYALKAYIKVTFGNDASEPKLLNCHFSSKKKIREKSIDNIENLFCAFDYIPEIDIESIVDIGKGGKKILLLDNNVTTFETINVCKSFFERLGNNVYSAVTSVNYDNMVAYLQGDERCEKLISNWRNVLFFKPIEEYVTAFNTWKTSEKTKMLESIFYSNGIYNGENIYRADNCISNGYIKKICRVHNLYDLNLSVLNGYNMIGIHAVCTDKIKYLINELKYTPIICENRNTNNALPIAIFEVESIRAMQKYLSENKSIKQAVIFERALDVELMRECCNIYGIPLDSMYVQLQYRTSRHNIKSIKSNLCKNLIVAMGLFQHDFNEYFWYLNKTLCPDTDYILLDCSKHQPDLIANASSYNDDINKLSIAKGLMSLISGNTVPIILADDTSVDDMAALLSEIKTHNIKFAGIDMQNCVEINPREQQYQMFKSNGCVYQGKIRKSATFMSEWKNILIDDRGNRCD